MADKKEQTKSTTLKTSNSSASAHKATSKKSSERSSSPLPTASSSAAAPLPLSMKEKSILEFIEQVQLSSGICPSYQEIKEHFGFASFNSVQNYLKQLIAKGYLHVPSNQKRAIQILHRSSAVPSRLALASSSNVDISAGPSHPPLLQSNEEVLSLPLLGKVAAGQPLESFKHNEYIKIPSEMVRNGSSTFALKVQGDSMINEGIFNGDTVLVQQQSHAKNGDIVVASVDNESTIKRFYLRSDSKNGKSAPQVELRPANDRLESMWFSPDEVQIQGILVGLLRKF